ncbi:hypothetical protein [Moorena sp. SIO3A5]|nr:hypothetical protein [Moorena sp. SIO3A5]
MFNYSLSYGYEVHRIFDLFPLNSSLLPAPCSLLPVRSLTKLQP